MRTNRFLSPGLGLLLTALPVQAQEAGFYKDLKIRLGYSPEAKDHLRQSSLGFGFNVGYATPQGKWALELGYYYKTGDQYIEPVNTTVPAGLSPVDTSHSGDSRRNQLDGFAVRVSYARPFSEGWEWQAGLMIGGTRFKHEYVGDVSSENWTSNNATSWRDTYSGTPQNGGLKVSPYAGVSWTVTDHSSLELNLLILNYTALNYVHRAGTGTYALSSDPNADTTVGRISEHNGFPNDGLEKSTRYVPQLEIGYVIHF